MALFLQLKDIIQQSFPDNLHQGRHIILMIIIYYNVLP